MITLMENHFHFMRTWKSHFPSAVLHLAMPLCYLLCRVQAEIDFRTQFDVETSADYQTAVGSVFSVVVRLLIEFF